MRNPVEINLKRRIEYESYSLMMTVSKFERQNEILAILKLFEDHDTITKSMVNVELLSEPDNSFYGQNILSAVELYGLIKRNPRNPVYSLTEAGSYALKKSKIPLPDRGVFKVLISRDPILAYEILEIKSIKNGELKRDPEKKLDPFSKEFVNIMEKWSDKPIDLPGSNLESVIFKDFDKSGAKIQNNDNYTLSLIVRLEDKPELYFIGKSKVRMEAPDDLDSFKILRELLSKYGNLVIKQGEQVLLLETAGLSIHEIREFSKDFNLAVPKLKHYGTFEAINIKNIKIFPSSVTEAREWAEKLILDGINRYMGEKEYGVLVKTTCKKFEPEYGTQNLMRSMPIYESLVEKALSKEKEMKGLYWYLVAPVDLSPRSDDYDRN
jgi:hypothetical protein